MCVYELKGWMAQCFSQGPECSVLLLTDRHAHSHSAFPLSNSFLCLSPCYEYRPMLWDTQLHTTETHMLLWEGPGHDGAVNLRKKNFFLYAVFLFFIIIIIFYIFCKYNSGIRKVMLHILHLLKKKTFPQHTKQLKPTARTVEQSLSTVRYASVTNMHLCTDA